MVCYQKTHLTPTTPSIYDELLQLVADCLQNVNSKKQHYVDMFNVTVDLLWLIFSHFESLETKAFQNVTSSQLAVTCSQRAMWEKKN